MNTVRISLAIGLGGSALALSGCTVLDPAAYEANEAPACFVDHGAWAGEPLAARYVEAGFHDIYEHFGPFLADLERAAAATAGTPPADWPASFEPLHVEAMANIVRVGRLLPRLNRPLDIPPMIDQVGAGEIWWPRGDARAEFLRVALAEEFVEHQNLGEHLVGFLTALEQVERLLLALKTEGTEADRQQLVTAIAALAEGWEGVEPGFRRVIFDRPQMPVGESLRERLEVRVRAICDAYSTCDTKGGGCGPTTESDGLTGPPMDDGL